MDLNENCGLQIYLRTENWTKLMNVEMVLQTLSFYMESSVSQLSLQQIQFQQNTYICPICQLCQNYRSNFLFVCASSVLLIRLSRKFACSTPIWHQIPSVWNIIVIHFASALLLSPPYTTPLIFRFFSNEVFSQEAPERILLAFPDSTLLPERESESINKVAEIESKQILNSAHSCVNFDSIHPVTLESWKVELLKHKFVNSVLKSHHRLENTSIKSLY